MITNRIVSFSVLIATLIICADVFAHGNPVAHFKPHTAEDPCWERQCEDSDYSGGHGHINREEDGKVMIWGYWTCEGYQYLFPETDCGEEPEPPQREPEPPQREPEPPPETAQATDTEKTTSSYDERNDPMSGTCIEWDFTESPYIGFPVLPDGVETIASLRTYLYKRTKKWVNIGLLIDGRWQWYPGANRGLRDTPLTPHLGVYVSYRDSVVEVCGEPVAGESVELTVREGWMGTVYLLGFPEVPASYPLRSDLLVDNLTWVKRKVWVGDFKNTVNETVHRGNLENDTEIKPGQVFMVRVTGDVDLDLRGPLPVAPSAPSAPRQNTLATSWGRIKSR